MPELPEVETIRLQLENKIIGRKILSLRVFQSSKVLGDQHSLIGKHILSTLRLGKYLILVLEEEIYCVIHLKMSGRLIIEKIEQPYSKHLKAAFEISGHLRLDFHDVRKFGILLITKNLEEIYQKIGIEPISDYFTFDAFTDILAKKGKTKLKTFLLDQESIAGIGNIYADEICFDAKLSPFKKIISLNEKETLCLFNSIKKILKEAIARQGTSLGKGLSNFKTPYGEMGRNFEGLKVYGQEGLNCLRCEQVIQKCKFAGRGTHFCVKCQSVDNNEGSFNRC